MCKDGRKSVSNVHVFASSQGKVFQVGSISAILFSTLEALADPKRLVKGWKSASQSAMQLMGFERRPVNLTVSNWKPVQGETLAIVVSIPDEENFIDSINLAFRMSFCKNSLVEVTCGEERFSAFSTSFSPSTWRTLIPLSPSDTAGQRSLIVDVNDGKHESFHGVIEVLEKEYPIETIWLIGNKSGIHGCQGVLEIAKNLVFYECTEHVELHCHFIHKLIEDGPVQLQYVPIDDQTIDILTKPLSSAKNPKEFDAVKVLVSNRTAKQYWDGSFRLPIQGEVTAEYGLKRCYNGVFASGYYHKGIDYGAPCGEPVWSPAAARVSLVGREEEGFALHGNCVGLDHGHGVTSILMHLDTILVENGMVVQAGDLLGTVGDSGLATGPHLHWGLYVHGKAVDQNQWIREQSWLQ